MRTCGLDISTCTGIALVGGEEDGGKTIKMPEQKGFQRLQLIAQEVENTLHVWQPELILVEWYAFSRNLGSLITLVEIGTVIRSMLYRKDYLWFDVNVKTLKKWLTGSGSADKELMHIEVKKRWGYSNQSHDIIDAYALAQMGQLGPEALLKLPGVVRGPD